MAARIRQPEHFVRVLEESDELVQMLRSKGKIGGQYCRFHSDLIQMMPLPPNLGIQSRWLGKLKQIHNAVRVFVQYRLDGLWIDGADDVPVKFMRAIIANVQRLNPPLGPCGNEVRKPPHHVGINKMRLRGRGRNSAKGSAFGDLKLAVKKTRWLNLFPPIWLAVGPGRQGHR